METVFPENTSGLQSFSSLKILVIDVKPNFPLPSTRRILDQVIARQPIISFDWVLECINSSDLDEIPGLM